MTQSASDSLRQYKTLFDTARRHPVYEKIVRQTHRIHAHDERNEAGEGDVVRVVETRKLSRTKHWRLIEIVEKAR